MRPRAHTSAAGDILCATKIAQDSLYLLPVSGRKQSFEPGFRCHAFSCCTHGVEFTPHDVTGSAAMAARLAACRGRLPPHTERAGRRPLATEAGCRPQGGWLPPPRHERAGLRPLTKGAGSRPQQREPGERRDRRTANMLVFAARRASCQGVVHSGAQRSVSCSRGCPVGRSYRAASLT